MASGDSYRIGEIEGLRTVRLVHVSKLLRMACGSFLMPMCGSVGGERPI